MTLEFLEPYIPLIQVVSTIGGLSLFFEWRFKVLHGCDVRVEKKLDKHLEESDKIKERFFKLEERVENL